jgi:hypothetical protein
MGKCRLGYGWKGQNIVVSNHQLDWSSFACVAEPKGKYVEQGFFCAIDSGSSHLQSLRGGPECPFRLRNNDVPVNDLVSLGPSFYDTSWLSLRVRLVGERSRMEPFHSTFADVWLPDLWNGAAPDRNTPVRCRTSPLQKIGRTEPLRSGLAPASLSRLCAHRLTPQPTQDTAALF